MFLYIFSVWRANARLLDSIDCTAGIGSCAALGSHFFRTVAGGRACEAFTPTGGYSQAHVVTF